MSRIISISLCVAAVLGFGCRPGAERQTAAETSDIPVGVYAATSGSEAAFGQATVQGEQLAAEEINNAGGVLGKKIRLVIADDQGKDEEGRLHLSRLLHRPVPGEGAGDIRARQPARDDRGDSARQQE